MPLLRSNLVSLEDRVAQLLKDYPMWIAAPDQLIEKLNVLRPRHSNARIDQWITWINQGNFEALVSDLLIHHYDPTYAHGAKRLNQWDRTGICWLNAGHASPTDQDQAVGLSRLPEQGLSVVQGSHVFNR